MVVSEATSNNGMHPTARSAALVVNSAVTALCARRVMPGVRCLLVDGIGAYENPKIIFVVSSSLHVALSLSGLSSG